MKADDFEMLRKLVHEYSGNLLEHYGPLSIENRLRLFALQNGFSSIEELLAKLHVGKDQGLAMSAVAAALNDETLFFRDARTFDKLRTEIIPELLTSTAGTRSLVIRSSACASGQEVYSVAMLLRDSFPDVAPSRVSLYGTDISPKRIVRAREGVYSQLEVNRGLPARYLVSYFEQGDGTWRIKSPISQWPVFKQDNVLAPRVDVGTVDLLLLRNVLIYFDDDSRTSVLDRAARQIASGGVLVLGACETSALRHSEFKSLGLGCYRRI